MFVRMPLIIIIKHFQALEQHFLAHFKINLASMALSRVGTYAAYIGCEGRVKVWATVNFCVLFHCIIWALTSSNATTAATLGEHGRKHCVCAPISHIYCNTR
jgi:hypothetical protein